MYRRLSSREILNTLIKLESRISDRFPNSSLAHVCAETVTLLNEVKNDVEVLSRPYVLFRTFQGIIAALFVAFVYFLFIHMNLEFKDIENNKSELMQNIEALTNLIVLIAAAVFFLFSIERKYKRTRALKKLNEIRSLAHVIDMHQLTKDPSRDVNKNTEHSPTEQLPPFMLVRYLDYCSELLSLLGKVSSLYAESCSDELILSTVTEVETLTADCTFHIWQKIAIVQEGEAYSSQ